jgi:hypothetical protein
MIVNELINTFFRSSGPGGAVVIGVVVIASVVFIYLTRWIMDGGKDEEQNLFR